MTTTEVIERIALSAACIAWLTFAPMFGKSQEHHPKFWEGYYPLSKGNTWEYAITNKTAEKLRQTWKVVNLSSTSRGPVFAVWPTPAESDDDGMQLQFTREGLKELGNDFYILRFPLLKGSSWGVDRHQRVFTVVSEGEPCAVGKYKFSECAVIQDDDREARLRTVTTYAFGAGPVRYEYFRLKGGQADNQPTQTLEVLSYSVKPTKSSKIEKPGLIR